jgi:molybdenum cofactor synthesis domain-containing protein
MVRSAESAAMLLVGNELLSGKTADENLLALAKTLRALGVDLRSAVFVKDDPEAIAREVVRLRADHDVVFTSGGVGPTHDDVTVEAVARAFDVELVAHPDLALMLESAFGPENRSGYSRMTLVPRGAELLLGSGVTWPTIVLGNVWMLPGVPEIFRMKLAVVREHIVGPVRFFTKLAYTRLDETELKASLDAIVLAFPTIEVGSYPKRFDQGYRTQVTFDGKDAPTVERALAAFCATLPEGALERTE